MTREAFDKQLQYLLDEIIVLGSLVEDAIIESVNALRNRDLKKSKKIYKNDKTINAKRFQIET